MYEVCLETIQPYNMKSRDIYWRRYKKHCTEDNDNSVPFKVGTLGPHKVHPIAISLLCRTSSIGLMVRYLFPFKGDFSVGKTRSHRAPQLGCRESESPGWFDVSLKNSAWDMIHERAHCCDEAAIRQLPTAAAFWMFKLNAKFDAHLLLSSFSHF